MKALTTWAAAMLLAASGQAAASPVCKAVHAVVNAEMFLENHMLDACLESKGAECTRVIDYLKERKDDIFTMMSLFEGCTTELIADDADAAMSTAREVRKVSDKVERLTELLKKTGGKF